MHQDSCRITLSPPLSRKREREQTADAEPLLLNLDTRSHPSLRT
jgi:hypothetical protein